MSFEIGSTVGDYQVVAVLGAGGMGQVYKVRNVISNRVEAMKVLLPDLVNHPDRADRFLREIQVQGSLEHPNIASLHTAVRLDNQLVMLIEFVEGVTLEQKARRGPLPAVEAVNYIMQALAALDYAHSRGVVHRDIKPANMMLTPGGVVKVLDFGIAKAATDQKLTMTGAVVGSLYYMSPEQIQDPNALDRRSDLYSLGVSLYELVTGKQPFEGVGAFAVMSAHQRGNPVPPITINPRLPQSLNDVILMSVMRDPNERYRTAGAFRNALAKVEAELKGVAAKLLHDADLAATEEMLPLREVVAPAVAGPGYNAAAGPRYNNSPPLPANFVDRPELLTRLREALLEETPNRNLALTALQGMGGIGKTVLAQALCRDQVVQDAYPDGIFWFTIGKESRLRFDQRIQAVPGLNQLLGAYNGEEACVSQYRNALRDKAALIVLDDVWRAADIEPFQTESPRSRFLFTTRDTSIARSSGARECKVDLLDAPQSRELLALWAGLPIAQLPPAADDILRECDCLPLALSTVGALLRGAAPADWADTARLLHNAELTSIEEQLPPGQQSFFRAIDVSVNALPPDMQQRYGKFAVLLEDMPALPPVLETLWNCDDAEARRIGRRLAERSLAQRDSATGGIRLHDLQLDYVRAQYPDQEALASIHGAVRLSAHVIEKDPRQFASQVLGRLLPHRDAPAIQRFIDEIAAGAPPPWVRPLHPALHPPGTPLLRTLEGHSAGVSGVAVTPDGRRAVSASGDRTLKVWDLDTGRALRTLEGHSDTGLGVAVTPDGKRAVSGSEDNTLKVWDLDTGRALHTLEGHIGRYSWIYGVAVTPDGKRAVSASGDGTLKVWDLNTGRALYTLKAHSFYVFGVAVTTDGKRAVSASADKTLKVWDLGTGRALYTLEGHSGPVHCVAVTPDSKRAVSASRDKTLKVWDLDTGRALRTLEGHSASVCGVAVTPDGRRAVSASADNTLKVWDLESGRTLRTLEGHSAEVYGVAVTPDGNRVVSASSDNTLKVWDIAEAPAPRDTGRAPRKLEGHSAYVYGVAVTPDGKRAVSASRDHTLKVWDMDTGRALRTLEGHSGYVSGVTVTPDGKRAVSASEDNTLKVWDLDTGRALCTLEGHTAYVSGVAVTPDGKRAVSASGEHLLKLWDLDTGRALRTLEGHSAGVSGVAVTPDGKGAVSASWDQTLKVWDLDTGRALRTLEGHSAPVSGVAVTADGKRAVSASWDHTLAVWDLDTGRVLHTLEGHSGYVRGVAVTGDGKRAVSASMDKTLKVWEVDTGHLIATFHCDANAHCCALADARRIVAGDRGGRVYILRLEE